MHKGLFIFFIGIALIFLISYDVTAHEGICEGCHENSLKEWTLGVHSHYDIYCEDCHSKSPETPKETSCEGCHTVEEVHLEIKCKECHRGSPDQIHGM